MPTTPQSYPLSYDFHDLPSFTQEEVTLWNWLCHIGLGHEDWSSWTADILGHFVQRPDGVQIRLVQSHALDAQFGEKSLTFGSKSEILIGRDSESDVVLPAKAISKHHARLTVTNNRAYLEDLGGKLGTYLWDKRLNLNELQLLSDGDQFSIFPYRFRIGIERCWSPEKDISFGKSRIQVLCRRDFLAMSPLGWRILVLNSQPFSEPALLTMSSLFVTQIQQNILAPLGLEHADVGVPSDDAIIAFVISVVLDRLNRRLKFPLQFSLGRNKQEPGAADIRGMFVSAPVKIGELSTEFRVFLPFDILANCMTRMAPVQHLFYPDGLCWSFPVSSAFVDLMPDEILQVGIGDLLVTERAFQILFPNDFCKGWSLLQDGSNTSSLIIDKYFERSMQVESTDEASATTAKPDLASLPVRLHVIVGQRDFTVAEITSLAPGTIIDLRTERVDPVFLMVNGKMLGEGQLVEIDGMLAVKVLGWTGA